MTTKTLRQHQLFWIYVRHEGKCSVCGGEVSPEDATMTDDDLPLATDISYLDRAGLAHKACHAEAGLGNTTLRAA